MGAAPAGSGGGLDNPSLDTDQDTHIHTEELSPGVVAGGARPPLQPPGDPLPDLLDSHMLPPYVQARRNQHRDANRQRRNRHRSRGQRRSSRGRRQQGPTTQLDDPEARHCCQCNKDCCTDCITVVTTFRWVLVSLAMLGVCCVVTGIILGALHMTIGNSFLTLSLMFIGKMRSNAQQSVNKC